MSIYEYNAEKHIRQEKEESWEEGRKSVLLRLIKKKLQKGMSASEIADMLEEDEKTVKELMKEVSILPK